jgi:hypothetical protein
MPVILSPEHYDLWLDPGFGRADALKEMLNPFDATLMRRYPVHSDAESDLTRGYDFVGMKSAAEFARLVKLFAQYAPEPIVTSQAYSPCC